MKLKEQRTDREFRYVLRRCNRLSDSEHRFLSLIATYQHGSLMRQDEIAELCGWTDRKVRRVISSLKAKGLIEVGYRFYKKMKLRIVSAEKQKAFAQGSDRTPMSDQRPDTSVHMTGHPCPDDRTPVSGPMLEFQLERKLERELSTIEEETQKPSPNQRGWMRLVEDLKKSGRSGEG